MEETVTVVLQIVSKRDAKILFDSYKNGTLFFGSYITRLAPGDKIQELDDAELEAAPSVPENIPDEGSTSYERE